MSKNVPENESRGFAGGKRPLDGHAKKKLYVANVWYSWQKFTGTVHNVMESEWNTKTHDISVYIAHFCDTFKFVSPKLLLISALPLLMYLSVFKSYLILKEVLHLPEDPHLLLPVIEYRMFRCLPHQILSRKSGFLLDILAALPYLIHFILPFLFITFLTLRRRTCSVPLMYQYLWCVGWVNLIAVVIQFLFPTAPPWFNDSAVFNEVDGSIISAAPNEAAFQRIDAFLGFPWFHNIYGQSPLKYGSFPSLHVAWPTVILLHRPWGNNKVGLAHVLWITWAALYSSHHYLVDALGGITLVVIVKLCMNHIWEPFAQKNPSDSKPRLLQRLTSCSRAV